MSEELKPCPFCGNEDVGTIGNSPAYVYCRICGAHTDKFLSKLVAKTQWNRRVSGWIKTSERLPEKDQCVLFVFEFKPWKPQVYMGCMHASKMWYIYGVQGYVEGKNVPCWMPLPEPPGVEE